MTVADFLRAYRYGRRPRAWLTGWLRLDEDYPVGDCEDFAWSMLCLVEGGPWRAAWAVLTLRAVFWFVDSEHTFPEQPRHTILWHKRHGWIDSAHPYWREGVKPAPDVSHRRPLAWLWWWFQHPEGHDLWLPWGPVALLMAAWGSAYKAVWGNLAVVRGRGPAA